MHITQCAQTALNYINTSYRHLEHSKLIYPRMLLMQTTQCAQTVLHYIKTSYQHLEHSKLIYPRMLLIRNTKYAQTTLSEIPNVQRHRESYPLRLTSTSRDFVLNMSTFFTQLTTSAIFCTSSAANSLIFSLRAKFQDIAVQLKNSSDYLILPSASRAICLDLILGFDPAISASSSHCAHFNRQCPPSRRYP
jgi:hypothetical protein